MIKSFTSKIKTFVFSDRSGDNNVTEGRKRKRDISEGEEEDVIVTSVKRARKVGPHTSALNYFNTLIVNPYQKMAEWMQRRKPWSEHYFFKRALSKDEAPNRDPGIVHSTTEDPLTVGNPPAMTKHVVGVTDGFKLPREGVKLTGNGHQSHNLPVGVPDVAARWTEDRHTSNLTSHPAPMRSPTQSNSNTVPSLSQSNHTSTSVQTDHSGNGRTPVRSQLDSSRTSESRHSRVSAHRSPGSPDFQSSKYLSEEWMLNLERQFSRANREAQRKIEETEIKKKFYEEKHLKKDLLLERQVRQRLRLYDAEPAAVEDLEVEEEEEEQEETFPELTDEMLQVVNDALRPQPADEVLVEGYKLQIRRHDMESLAGLNWLNDEIINFYMNQLVERGETEGKPKVYAFNTFFYPKVMSQGHSSVKRWTRRVDIFSKDYILIPVHLGMHWCLAVIDFKKKMIRYFDSMGGNNMACLNALKEYLCAESLDKKKQKFDLTDWKTKIVKDIPQQMNGSDCGMFTCKFAEYITREADINFTQEHMPYFRKRMVYEIVRKKLLQ
ncbi:sentrin-specific protease 1-like isoform X3 [Ostrea edulis]|uniref:sentrin-specific protease 1-like isoform X3 n=1 Tax=Ostrea edulis TaxID=37623 RepID=UPI0024AF7213|nr:sentrin-specific protease 1-like isoform X3 [Ostrea edulis]